VKKKNKTVEKQSFRLSKSEQETARLGEALAQTCRGGEVISLEGSLGMGKTVFAKGIARGLGIDEREITSPSFVLVREHRGRLILFHIDLFRIDRVEEMQGLGLEECFGRKDAVSVVEWGQKMIPFFGEPSCRVRFEDLGGRRRKIVLTPACSSVLLS
jgi:tRNA threonylcarbamoyladenosine biosynthesis protein TsaE